MSRPGRKAIRRVALTAIIAQLLLAALVFVPGMIPARTSGQRNLCKQNLRLFENAKEMLALEKQLQPGAAINEADLQRFIPGVWPPKCPSGGTYTIGDLVRTATCSVKRHKLERNP